MFSGVFLFYFLAVNPLLCTKSHLLWVGTPFLTSQGVLVPQLGSSVVLDLFLVSFSPLPCIFMGLIFTSCWIECTVKQWRTPRSHLLIKNTLYTHQRFKWFLVLGIIKLNSLSANCPIPIYPLTAVALFHQHWSNAQVLSLNMMIVLTTRGHRDTEPGFTTRAGFWCPCDAKLWQVLVTVHWHGLYFSDIWNTWFGKSNLQTYCHVTLSN